MSEQEFGLVMPFVACRSNGGPFHDGSYVAGYEMGALDQTLAASTNPLVGFTQTIHAGNRAQADLIAMRHGFTMTVDATAYDEWAYVTFQPVREVVV